MDEARASVVDRWVSDFLDSPRFLDHPSLLREYAPEVLSAFLRGACDARGVGPEDVEEADLKRGFLDGVARLDVPASVREGVPGLVAAFLEAMEAQGRLAGGGRLGLLAAALKPAYLEAASGKAKPFVAAAPKVGRNDDCPCGSGRKYKRCCLGRLGG